MGDIPYELGLPAKVAAQHVSVLVSRGLLDETGVDGILAPHNWEARQFVSDTSSGRVKQFRERSKLGIRVVK